MNTTDRTNIADRSRAALMGHETRKKRQSVSDEVVKDLEIRHSGAKRIQIWWKTLVSLNPEMAKDWKGGTPMGYDGSATQIIKGVRPANDLPAPADYLTVQVHLKAFGLDSSTGVVQVAKYGRRVTQSIDGENHKKIVEFQRFLGSI